MKIHPRIRERFSPLLAIFLCSLLGYVLGKQVLKGFEGRRVKVLLFFILVSGSLLIPVEYLLYMLVFLIYLPMETWLATMSSLFCYVVLAKFIMNSIFTNQKGIKRTPLDLPIIFILVSYFLSFYNVESHMLIWNLRELFRMVSSIVIFYLVFSSVENERDLHRLATVILFGSSVVLGISLVQMIYPEKELFQFEFLTEKAIEGGRVTGVFGGYESMAEFVALLIPLQLFMIFWEKKTRVRMVYCVLLIFTVTILFATSTRGAFVSLVFGLFYLGYLAKDIINVKKYLFYVTALGTIFFLVNVVMVYTESSYLIRRLLETKIEGGLPDTRAYHWPYTLKIALEHPIVGFGPFFRAYGRFLYPHNLYIFLLHVTGVIGLSAFLWFIAKLFFLSQKAIKTKRDLALTFSLGLTIVLQVDLVIFLIDQLKIEYFRTAQYANFIWLLFGLLAASASIARKVETKDVNQ